VVLRGGGWLDPHWIQRFGDQREVELAAEGEVVEGVEGAEDIDGVEGGEECDGPVLGEG
jgi:hypothetical protein